MPADEFAPSRLAEFVARHLNVAPERLTVERCATGRFNTTYFVAGGPEPVVLRIAPPDDPSRLLFYEYRMMRQEPTLHALLRAQTTVPVPAVLAWDPTRRRLDREYLILERLPGRPLSEPPSLAGGTREAVLRQVGRCLRQVHAITSDRYGYTGEHQPMTPQRDWPSAFHIMWTRLLDDVERCGGYRPDESASLRRLLDRHLACFDRPVPAALLHMDIWAQNLLVDAAGRLTGVLDWDRALWGDPEIEFAVLDFCGISEPALWEGYGAAPEQSPEAAVRHRFYHLYEVQKYIFIRKTRGPKVWEADVMRRHCLALAHMIPK
jgi:aminoglycoside phosphotransferase (APT) family kinase protein